MNQQTLRSLEQRMIPERTLEKKVFEPEVRIFEEVGNAIPLHFFVTSGVGESNVQHHAGSFHLALAEARIEGYNIQRYSSILPAVPSDLKSEKGKRGPITCEELSIDEGKQFLSHGSELQTITAECSVRKRERATAGIIYGRFQPYPGGQDRGGLVCEFAQKNCSEKRARDVLRESLEEVHAYGDWNRWEFETINVVTRSFIPKKEYGTALVAMCFVKFLRPVYGRVTVAPDYGVDGWHE